MRPQIAAPTAFSPRGFDRDLWILIALAALKLAFHTYANVQYGFHRDELQTLADARHLAWGYVAYPPLTPFFGRIELLLFGTSLSGFRFFAALAQSVAFVVTGLIARRLGGGLAAMLLAASATALAGVSLAASSLMQYVSFDYLWFVLIAYFMVCRITSGDERWWLGIGAAVGLALLTKYSIAFFVCGLGVAVLCTPLRADLRSRWPWIAAAIAAVLFLPNFIWLAQHDFITLEFLRHIHARDVRIGRAESFWLDQINGTATNPFTAPLWILGLYAVWFRWEGRYRALAFMTLVPIAVVALAQGRGYYTAPLYPMLFAAGAVTLQQWLARRGTVLRGVGWSTAVILLACGCIIVPFVVPIAPVGSSLWSTVSSKNYDFREEVGWPELAAEVARIWNSLPEEERAQGGIWGSHYGAAGALELYGPALGLPPPISAVNSFWLRGPPRPVPKTMIVIGADRKDLDAPCTTVELAGHTGNQAHVENEESKWHPDIFICRGVRKPLDAQWPTLIEFG